MLLWDEQGGKLERHEDLRLLVNEGFHRGSKVYRCVSDGDPEYLIVSRWTDEDAFRTFIRSDRFRKVTDWGAENILTGPPRHTTYGAS